MLQERSLTYAFVTETMPLLEAEGIDARVYYVASVGPSMRRRSSVAVAPLPRGARARGHRHHRLHVGDALPLGTLLRRPRGDSPSLPPWPVPRQRPGQAVLAEAGLDGASQFAAIKQYLDNVVVDPTEHLGTQILESVTSWSVSHP